MRVLVLAWGVEPGPLGPSAQAAGLATALAAAGHEVRLVTRPDPAGPAVRLARVEVHAVADPPPIVPAGMRDPALDALAVAGRATSVAVRRLEERPVDVVHAEGWPTAPVVAALRTSHGVRVLATGSLPTGEGTTRGQLAAALLAAADAHAPRGTGAGTSLPAGTDLPLHRPGPPPAQGPVHLRAPAGTTHRVIARRLRAALTTPRRISHTWGRRPGVVVVLDPDDLDTVVRGLAAGVPVVTVAGPTGAVVEAHGAGVVVAAEVDAAAAAVDELLGDRARATALGAAAATAAADHAWPRAAAAWTGLATTVVRAAAPPRLHAAG